MLGLVFICSGCRDVVFNNPLDPDAARADLKIVKTFVTALSGEGDIAHDGEKIWKADRSGRIAAFDPLSGFTIRSLQLRSSSGIAYHDQLLYLAVQNQNALESYDPLSGALVKIHSTGQYYFQYLASTGSELIAYDSRTSSLFLYQPDSGEVSPLFPLSGFRPGGMAFCDGRIVISELNSNTVYFFDIDGQVSNIYNSPVQSMSGITVDPASLTLCLFTINGDVYLVTVP